VAGKISARDIEEVKARINIADVIGGYVALKPASAGSLKGLCPFQRQAPARFLSLLWLRGRWRCLQVLAGDGITELL
jgi:DNA primase